MGGICGFTGRGDKRLIKSMCNAISHRGSKADYYIDDDISFAERALENETGIVKSGSMVIAFQGEIYNSRSVERQIARKGTKLNTSTDAELVLKLFEQNGLEAFGNLFGSFACAIWNALRKELTLARDHFGQSTLYYCFIDGEIFFASEIKSLLRVQDSSRLINLEALVNYLLYGYVPSPNTLFSGISKLSAASSIHFRQGTLKGPDPYWSFEFHPEILDENRAIDIVYHKILETVRLGVLRHKRFAILLSGGFDSSLLASMATKITDQRVNSYTFVVPGQENRSAEFIADQLDLAYHEVTVFPKDSIKIFESLSKVYTDLIADPFISLPTYVLVKAARYERAVFAADNADNIFWGLPSFYDYFRYLRNIRRIPYRFRKFLLSLTRKFKTTYPYQRSLENLLMASVSNEPHAFIGRILTHREVRKLIKTNLPTLNSHSKSDERITEAISLTDFYRHNLNTAADRPPNISRIGPLCSFFSLKLFEPFLNPRLVELGAKLPPFLKQPSGNTNKLILRKMALKHELLPKGFNPRKRGLQCSLDDWYRGELKEWVHQTLLDGLPNFIDKSYVKSLLTRKSFVDKIYERSSDYRTSTRDIFTLLMLALWFKEYGFETKL